MPKIKGNVTLKNVPKEITEYPNTNIILYTDGRRSYHYTVKEEGLYPQPPVLAYTQGKNKYKIPDYYCVETTWGRGNNKKTVKCSINYIEDKPLFKIMYGTNFSEVVQSNVSSTTVANEVLKKLFPRNEKSLISGVHLFGIHLRTLEHSREGKRENHPQLKSLELCDRSTIYKRQNKFGNQIKERVQIEGAKIYGEDQVVLKQISYNVKCMDFQIDYRQKNNIEKEDKLISLVRVIDQNHISREGYRSLATIEPNLEREWVISEQRIKITKEMNQRIAVNLIDIPIQNKFNFVRISDDFNSEIIQREIQNGKGGTRSAKEILSYIIPILVLDKVLDINDPTIHLRVSGDGRNVGRKIKHVMLTIAILNNEQSIHIPDHHFTTVLFPGTENYEILQIAMASFIEELNDLKTHGLLINDIRWDFVLYFSSDWKFLAICLGFNASNSNFFCPWCEVSKNDQYNQTNNWKISKQMEKINESLSTYSGHIKKPLFNMIPLENWVPDELHIMLRIWDRLWSLVISELKEYNQFDDLCREEIIQEMNQIGVKFQFWKEKEANVWNYTSLMGDDKLKVLRNFNLSRILPPSRARKIRELWDRFNQIYLAIKLKNYDPQQFQFEVEEWLELFLTPDRIIPNSKRIEKGLYSPSTITPYIHVLVNHISKFMEKHRRWGIKAFSCAPVEKKNHQQVTKFFQQTLKDGGTGRKSAIADILEHENRNLYYLFNYTKTSSTSKPKTIYIS